MGVSGAPVALPPFSATGNTIVTHGTVATHLTRCITAGKDYGLYEQKKVKGKREENEGRAEREWRRRWWL